MVSDEDDTDTEETESDDADSDADIVPLESTVDDLSHVEFDDDFDDEFDIDFDDEVDENLASFEAELNHAGLGDSDSDSADDDIDGIAGDDDF